MLSFETRKVDPKDFYFNEMPLNTETLVDDTTLRDGIQKPSLRAPLYDPMCSIEYTKRPSLFDKSFMIWV